MSGAFPFKEVIKLAYQKQNFVNYTVLTAEQLIKIEDGIVELEKTISSHEYKAELVNEVLANFVNVSEVGA